MKLYRITYEDADGCIARAWRATQAEAKCTRKELREAGIHPDIAVEQIDVPTAWPELPRPLDLDPDR